MQSNDFVQSLLLYSHYICKFLYFLTFSVLHVSFLFLYVYCWMPSCCSNTTHIPDVILMKDSFILFSSQPPGMCSVGCAGGAPCGRQRYCSTIRTPAASSQSAEAAPTGGMWPRNRTPSYNNTPFKQSTEERKAGPGGVSYVCVAFPVELPRFRGFLWAVRVFESRRCTLLAQRRHLDAVCTHRNFIQAFVSGMLAS